MKRFNLILALLLIFVGLFAGVLMSDVEKPKYKILSLNNNIELRQYDSIFIAEVVVEGQRKDAINKGFKILANYIFGGNSDNLKIEMTAPVKQQKTNNGWRISFSMPEKYNLDSLPIPKNKAVQLKRITNKKFATISFSGFNSDENITLNENLLKNYLIKNKMVSNNFPIYAFYNPPWTLPMFRRNEIMFEIE